MKKTVFTLALVFVGICFALNGSAQNDKVGKFYLQEISHPENKMVLTINPSKKEITVKINNDTASTMDFFDYKIRDLVTYSFSLLPDSKAPMTEEECKTSTYYVHVGSNEVVIMLDNKRAILLEYTMTDDARVEQQMNLLVSLTGTEPEGNTSASSESSSSKARNTTPSNKSTESETTKSLEVVKPILNKTPGLREKTPKELSIIDLITRPFGVLSQNSRKLSSEQIMFDLSDYGWIVKDHFDTTISFGKKSGYDMSFMGKTPQFVSADFSYDSGSTELYQFSYSFFFDKQADARRFFNQIVALFNAEGIQMSKEKKRRAYRGRYEKSELYLSNSLNDGSVTLFVSYKYSYPVTWIE